MRVKILLSALALLFASTANAGSVPPGSSSSPSLELVVQIGGSSSGFESFSVSPGTTSSGLLSFEMMAGDELFALSFETTADPDPFISGTFRITNLSSTTQDFFLSATLPITPIPGATVNGGSVGDVVFTDANGDNTVAISTLAGVPFFTARVDGVAVGVLGAFDNVLMGDGMGQLSGLIGQLSFGDPIPSQVGGPALDTISAEVRFNLSAGDSAVIPFFFQVEAVPEPASALLLVFGIGAVLARRRSC